LRKLIENLQVLTDKLEEQDTLADDEEIAYDKSTTTAITVGKTTFETKTVDGKLKTNLEDLIFILFYT
jgi:hypothetical protein